MLVDARIVVRPDEDADAVKSRIVGRLAEGISPLSPGSSNYGSGFGKPLRVSNLYRAMEEAEPGVQYVDRARLEVDKVPDTDALALVQAEGQDNTWFVAQDSTLFRTTNAGDGWEACAEFVSEAASETVKSIAPFRSPAPGRFGAGGFDPGGFGPGQHPGMVAVSTVTPRARASTSAMTSANRGGGRRNLDSSSRICAGWTGKEFRFCCSPASMASTNCRWARAPFRSRTSWIPPNRTAASTRWTPWWTCAAAPVWW
ncbi:conserved hypothetical protein [Arthrobacter sp. Hiyo8]|nr:conserved hypothetical protein [Arthrobacter sp. Hiyo8]